MGMDYKYAGSASYPRFDREIKQIVEIFGGVESKELIKRKETENERPLGYWFGYASSAPDNMEKYIFPNDTNEVLIKWFNHIYDKFSIDDTKIIYDELWKHKNEIENISGQIIYEFEALMENNEGWEIW